MGSYLIFEMEDPGVFRIVQEEQDTGKLPLLIGAVLGACGIIAVLLLVHRRRRKGRGVEQEDEQS